MKVLFRAVSLEGLRTYTAGKMWSNYTSRHLVFSVKCVQTLCSLVPAFLILLFFLCVCWRMEPSLILGVSRQIAYMETLPSPPDSLLK